MKADQQRIQTFREHSVALYFIDKYLLHEKEMEKGKMNIPKQSSNNEAFDLASKMLKSEISQDILQKHGYVLVEQNNGDISVKCIF